MTHHLTASFARHFGSAPDLIVRSPGRVNLIGEHTDYNEGWALPVAIHLGTSLAARRRADGVLHTVALRVSDDDSAPIAALHPRHVTDWKRYVRGMASLLHTAGYLPPDLGADVLIDGDLPLGGGLSSSASLEMGLALALLSLAGQSLDGETLARYGQRVENEIVGVQSGLMDQLAVVHGVAGHALLLDFRTLALRAVSLPPDVRIVVFDSAVPRTLAGSGYNQRRAECAAALAKLHQVQPGLQALRDVSPALLQDAAAHLTATEQQRVQHVISENQRVLESVAALERQDSATFGRLMAASHASLRDQYAVSVPDIDTLVALAAAQPGVFGARITGGGFGGCVVALVAAAAAEEVATQVCERYQRATGRTGTAYVCQSAQGTHLVQAEM